jgi:hypothetical protein
VCVLVVVLYVCVCVGGGGGGGVCVCVGGGGGECLTEVELQGHEGLLTLCVVCPATLPHTHGNRSSTCSMRCRARAATTRAWREGPAASMAWRCRADDVCGAAGCDQQAAPGQQHEGGCCQANAPPPPPGAPGPPPVGGWFQPNPPPPPPWGPHHPSAVAARRLAGVRTR